jgi:hypothetical protein
MWRELTPDSLLRRLASDEHAALATAATELPSVLEEIAADVAAEWRGRLVRHTQLSRRARALPSELWPHVLADFRYRAFTRLPGMGALLDELRVSEWKRAMHVMDNIAKVQIEPPEPEDLPAEDSGGAPSPCIHKALHEYD